MKTLLLLLSLFAVVHMQSSGPTRIRDGSVQIDVPAGDAPYSHKRLYGIRRLKVLRPLVAYKPPKSSERRRQQRRFSSVELEEVFVPRAVAPPSLSSTVVEGGSRSSEVEDSSTEKVVVQSPETVRAEADDAKRKRIEARWKRLGIDFREINYPHQNYGHQRPSTRVRQLQPSNQETVSLEPKQRPRVDGPILVSPSSATSSQESRTSSLMSSIEHVSTSSTDYHSRTKPVQRGLKFKEEKLSVRPRLTIRKPGEKRPVLEETEDPNLTPFENNARAKFGYGTLPPAPTFAPRPTTTTTTEATTTTEKYVEEATEENGVGSETGGDSGAGVGFGPSELPPEFANLGFGIGGGDNGFNFNVPAESTTEAPTTTTTKRPQARAAKVVQRKPPNANIDKDEVFIPQNSGLRVVEPPKEFNGGAGFGGGSGGGAFGGFGGGGGGIPPEFPQPEPEQVPEPSFGGQEGGETGGEDIFTGDSALTRSRGPTGDGYGPPVFPEGNPPPPVPSVGLGGAAAGKSPYESGGQTIDVTENPRTTIKPSALLSVLTKADTGFNQAIDHFEHGTPMEAAAIDILEVALGSQKLDSQAKLLGHVDRTIGLDNLQRLQRWANTAGAMDIFKEQFVKFAKNFQPAADLLPTVPPQLEYLFKTSGKK